MVPGYTGLTSSVKTVSSIREIRFANVIEQKTDFSCGAAAVATLLRYGFGRDVTEEMVIAGMLTGADVEKIRQLGFSMLDIKRYANSIGLRASGILAGFDRLRSLKIPVIILLDGEGYKHFVLLKHVTEDHAYVADPAMGNRRLDIDDFKKQWNGVLLAFAGPGYQRNTPLVQVSPILSARALVDTAQPVDIAELIEYGFRHSDFF